MMGSEERGVPVCFTTFEARAPQVQTLNGLASPIVPTRTISSADAVLFEVSLLSRSAMIAVDYVAATASCSRLKLKSVLLIHMQSKIVASFRATATRARAIPRCLAIFMPHARKADHFLLRESIEWAAS